MAELVQATPEELDAFAKKCNTKAEMSATTVSKAIKAVESVRARWGGGFANAYGQQWAQWRKDMNDFPKETRSTAEEMAKLAGIYRDADEKATKVTVVIGTIGMQGGGVAGVDPIKTAEAWSTWIGQNMDAFQKYIPDKLGTGSTALSALLDVWTSKTPEEALASVVHTGLMTAACLTPVGLAMVVANAGTQLVGDKSINLATWFGQCVGDDRHDKLFLNNEKKLLGAWKKIDIVKVTKNVALNWVVRPFSAVDRPKLGEPIDKTVELGLAIRDMANGLLIHLGIGISATGNRIGDGAIWTRDWVYSELTTPTPHHYTVTSDAVVPAPLGVNLPWPSWKTMPPPRR